MGKSLRVLIVDDSADDAMLVLRQLRKEGYEPEWERVDEAPAMRAALEKHAWDIVVSDWNMPRFTALGALRLLEEVGCDIPLIIVSGTIGEERAIDALRAGARDFVAKDRLARLGAAIDRELVESRGREAHRQLQGELRLSEERYRALFEGSPQPMWLYDLDTLRFLAVNEAAVRHYGYSREEFAALTVAQLRPHDEPGTDVGTATRHRTKAGAILDVETNAHDFDFEGRAVRLVLVNDVTERNRAQAALRKSEEQLKQAQKMEAIGSLAGGVAHDFNNLLTVIVSYSSMLVSELLPGDPMREALDEILRASKRATELTRQLLAFSRRQVLEPKVVDLDHIVTGMEKMLQRLIGEDIELSLVTAASGVKIHADPGQIEQVIMNLAVNARDAMPEGGKLRIETAEALLGVEDQDLGSAPGQHVCLSVRDTGSGMDAATRARIFEPFFTTKDVGKGTGLGLSTVFGIVKQSGGQIVVDSEPDKGTTFKIYLPRTNRASPSTTPAAPTARHRGSETILLVEDDDAVRAVARSILRRHGYDVLEAQNGGEALLIAEDAQNKIDLLLTDVVMPRMSGRKLVERLASVRPELKVVFMTGYTDDAIVHHGVRAASVAFLQKPITPEALLSKVREVLGQRS